MSERKGKMPTRLEYAAQDLRNTLFQARLFNEVWWLVEGEHPEREMIVKACNQHALFFQILRPGMYVAFIVLLGSLFDERDDCVTLKSIPEISADPSFATLWKKGRRLYRYRSKSIAHRDVQNDAVDFARATGFTYNEVRGILKEACDIYDRYALAHNLTPLPSEDFSSGKDLLQLLRKLGK